ncbi:MAG: EscU/YscU/HrcU family type III secretion system export apparatus switch protein, partial [Pseudomonadota bacterium]
IAKGAGLIALRIREIAQENGVELVESPPLARALYASTDLNSEIPAPLYLAVAQVLGFVFQLRVAREQGGPKPTHPRPEVPSDFIAAYPLHDEEVQA